MSNPKQPMAEVFGHLPTDFGERAKRCRKRKLCIFHNKVPNCTKDKAKNPLGVCSIHYKEKAVITCPIRFREDWLITNDAADFFFPEEASWTSLTEVRLGDLHRKSAGNIDIVLVAYDEQGKVYDFGSLEIQAVYISGNIREPYEYYMSSCEKHQEMDWTSRPNFPRPDFLSSSRKRLVPQLLFKGGIINTWHKKMAVALNESFFNTLPDLKEVNKKEADIAWMVYDLKLAADKSRYQLQRTRTIYTKFHDALNSITTPQAGSVEDFKKLLQGKVDEQMESPPRNRTIKSILGQ